MPAERSNGIGRRYGVGNGQPLLCCRRVDTATRPPVMSPGCARRVTGAGRRIADGDARTARTAAGRKAGEAEHGVTPPCSASPPPGHGRDATIGVPRVGARRHRHPRRRADTRRDGNATARSFLPLHRSSRLIPERAARRPVSPTLGLGSVPSPSAYARAPERRRARVHPPPAVRPRTHGCHAPDCSSPRRIALPPHLNPPLPAVMACSPTCRYVGMSTLWHAQAVLHRRLRASFSTMTIDWPLPCPALPCPAPLRAASGRAFATAPLPQHSQHSRTPRRVGVAHHTPCPTPKPGHRTRGGLNIRNIRGARVPSPCVALQPRTCRCGDRPP